MEALLNEENKDTNSKCNKYPSEHDMQPFVDVNSIAIIEYLNTIESEYQIERNKKNSFETRAGLILALLSAICSFLFKEIKLKDVFMLIPTPLSFISFIKIISGLGVYIGFFYTLIMTIKTIMVHKQPNFEVKNIDEELLMEPRLPALCKLIFTYRDIIIQHRIFNEQRAKNFEHSLYAIAVTLVFIIVYVTIE